MRFDRRRPGFRPIHRLVEAVEALTVVDAVTFAALLDGLFELRAGHGVDPSLIVIWAGGPRSSSAEVAEVVLIANLRDVDVISRRPDGSLAVLVDADPGATLVVAHRIHQLLRRATDGAPVSVGVASATGTSTALDLVARAEEALAAARRQSGGGVEVVD